MFQCYSKGDAKCEEADTRICIHVQPDGKLQPEMPHSNCVCIYYMLQNPRCTRNELIVAFGIGKNFNHDSINKLCHKLERSKCETSPLFHTFQDAKHNHSSIMKGQRKRGNHGSCSPLSLKPFCITHHLIQSS